MDRRQFIARSAGAAGLALLAQTAGAQEELNERQKVSTFQLKLMNVLVEDQTHALKFYTETIGFVKKQDFPIGGGRWLTVVTRDDPNGTELLLEPTGIPAAKVFQKAIFDMGVPYTAFAVGDIDAEYERLTALGVKFRLKPTKMGPSTIAHFEDTCGNIIQMFQV